MTPAEKVKKMEVTTAGVTGYFHQVQPLLVPSASLGTYGGITPRLGGFLEASPFRARFEAKGRFADYLAPIPVRVITRATSPALEGAAQALDLQGT